VPLIQNPIVVGDLTLTNHEVKNGRREFLVTVSGGIVGLAVGCLQARVLAQPAVGPPLNISTIGAGRERAALGAAPRERDWWTSSVQ
jgi:hypothetical protein